jgi:hypothetical protein
MKIAESARRHDVEDADMLHAFRYLITYNAQEYDEEWRLFVIGPDRNGNLLELILVPLNGPTKIIHAMPLREKNRHFLR